MAAVLSSDLTQDRALRGTAKDLGNRAVTLQGRGPAAPVAPEATALTTVAKRINIFAKNQLSSSRRRGRSESRGLVEAG